MSLPRSFALLAVGLATASAQPPAEAPVPPGVPIPGVVPPRPAGAPGVKPAVALGDTLILEEINEQKLTGDALAALYERYTGRRVIVSTAAAAAEFRFVQRASAAEPLTFAKAAELLRKAATIENFVFVPDGEDPNLDFLMVPTGGTTPRTRGVEVYTENGPVFSENDTLPEGDAVISYVMQLNYIKPVDAQNVFTQIIGQFGAYGSIAPVANASALIITENTSLIRKLIDLKKEIDKPGSVQGTRFIKVQYADVTEIADTLTTLLTAQQTGNKTAGVQRADAPAIPGAPPVAGGAPAGGGGGEESPVQIIPDPRTNRIFAMGRPVDLLFVEGLVREFDVETSEKNFLRRKLRFLTVSEFLPIAGDALTRAFSGTGDSGGGGGASGSGSTGGGGASRSGGSQTQSNNSGRSSRSSNSSSGANFGGSSGSSGFGSSGGGGGGGGSFGGSGGGSGGGGGQQISSAPESVLVGRSLLVADNITNSIVVQGPPSALEIIERLLDQIDVKPDQVVISAVIGQLTANDTNSFGVNYLFNNSKLKLGGGGNPGSITGGEDATSFPRFSQRGVTGSGFRAIGAIDDLGVYLEALQSKTDFIVLSRPSIFTSNNVEGVISSGERIAVPTQGGTSGGNFNSGTSIQYQDVVLKLVVTPLVNSDDEVTMKIELLNDEQAGDQIIEGAGTDGGNLTVPRITTREILTTATVPNGQTIVLGGLIVKTDDKTKSGIPILSDIPLLGPLFSTNSTEQRRSELMVFIQPQVVKNDRSLNAVQADMDSRYKVSPKALEMANGPGVLPPAGAVQPFTEKGVQPVSSPAYQPPASTQKPTIRPTFRR